MWNDEHHITRSYSETLGPEFSRLLPIGLTDDPGAHRQGGRVMAEADRRRWDERYRSAVPRRPRPPSSFGDDLGHFPASGQALELACGTGESAVWLALRGMEVLAVDASPVAIDAARRLAEAHGVVDRCRFEVFDLDAGLPPGPPVDLLLCHRFRDPSLYRSMIERLAPSACLAVAVLSEVGSEPGPFRATSGELEAAFGGLEIVAGEEDGGAAWILALAAGPAPTARLD